MREAEWAEAGRRLLAGLVEEYANEGRFEPEPESGGHFRLTLGESRWTFRAAVRGEHGEHGERGAWRVEPGSVRRCSEGAEGSEGAEPETLLLDAGPTVLGWTGPALAEALRALTAARHSEAVRLSQALPAADLANLGRLELEAHRPPGAPGPLLTRGRPGPGFAASDVAAYAPESARAVRLSWAAVHEDLATYGSHGSHGGPAGAPGPGLSAARLLAEELDPRTYERFTAALDRACAASGLPAGAFHWLPVHPYQWDEVVAAHFAAYLADGRVVALGQSGDRYRPLASGDTYVNLDRPHRREVRLPLLPISPSQQPEPEQQPEPAPEPELERHHIRRPMAAVTVTHPLYASIPDAPPAFRNLLGAVWYPPVTALLRGRERARALSALLLTGSDGRALITELVARSGLSARAWLERLFAVLPQHGRYDGDAVVLFDGRSTPVGTAVTTVTPGDVSPPDQRPYVLGALARLAADHLDLPEADFWSLAEGSPGKRGVYLREPPM
ncbi:IucA/IucC family protein [Streptomyces paludis]|uniref:Aerobactin siderophore biosynthesis IucA/IucC N-terminal domain-containing protein n=1 Tax=Streptomyces paludis TaxID=2282738 RepID=A0A345HQ13_9ACTN|nr:IucA/IucC family protein [Streptomyces paludis]AXG78787.1 hypothetical protein DVK44_14945 [Streptomyces paludis]